MGGNPAKEIYAKLNLKDFSIFITKKGVSFVIYRKEENEKKDIDIASDKKMKSGKIHYA